MALNDQDKKLLNDIFSASFKSPNGLNAVRFRADNEEYIPELNQLERLGYIRRSNDLYSITLMAFIYLSKENLDAQSIVQNCGLIFALLQGNYRDTLGEKMTVPDIAQKTGLSVDNVRAALRIIIQTSILGSFSSDVTSKDASITPSESILKYKSFEDILKEQEEWDKQSLKSRKPAPISPIYPMGQEIPLSVTSSKENWKAIKNEYGVTKRSFGRRINFVKNSFKRTVIYRDVEQAFILERSGFSKPAVILAGGVIEELLRLYLEQKGISPQKPLKKDFNGYVQTCVQNKLLKDSVSHLSDSVRGFRNLVHLSAEETKKHTISKSIAKGAVSSIFTIASDF